MPPTLFARELRTASSTIAYPVVRVDDGGLILSIESDPSTAQDEHSILTSTFLDIHTHGAAGHDVMQATPSQLGRVQQFLASQGVSHYLPTTVTASVETTLTSLERLASAVEATPQPAQAIPLGIHLEGPFLSHAKRGVHPASELQAPDISLFDRLYQAARGHVRLVTLAPELPGALELIAHCISLDVRVSLGHTDATSSQAQAAVEAGAISATHTFNAMRRLDHRDPGILGTVLDNESLYAELICDGIHVAPELVRLFWKAKGLNRAILVTDSISAAGMGDGTYNLGELKVTVEGARCLLSGTETLAGSVLSLPAAVRNFARFTGCPWTQAAALASHNPARMLGVSSHLGNIAPGNPANFNRFDLGGNLIGTYLSGQPVS